MESDIDVNVQFDEKGNEHYYCHACGSEIGHKDWRPATGPIKPLKYTEWVSNGFMIQRREALPDSDTPSV